jgi:two-component sensor histidine kinase
MPASAANEVRLLLCSLLVLLGLIVIVGWFMKLEPLKSVVPGLSTMKFNTAAGFTLTGAGLWAAGSGQSSARYAGAILGIAILALGTATVIEYGLDVNLGVDEAVVRDTGSLRGSGHPGRMSLLTAIAWLLLGTAIVLLSMSLRRAEVIAAHSLAMAAGAISILAAAGYAFGAEAFFDLGRYTAIAVHTAAGLLIAATAALMTRAREGWLQPYVDSPAALAFLSRLLPLSIGVPAALGLLIMLGAGLGAYDAPFGFALFIPLTCVAMVLTSLWVAAGQREAEQIRLRYDRHLQLVVAELNHRVKNTLAIVQSFAHQSLKSSANPQAAGKAFEGRLTALASAHNMLTRENWDNISLLELIANSLDAHNDTGTRFAVEGPDMAVSPKTAITLAMTLHELATNSTKYGALSVPDGFVQVRWRVADDRFDFEWKDRDGPAVQAPARTGFGSRMLSRALAAELGGKADLSYEADGLRYAISAPARMAL